MTDEQISAESVDNLIEIDNFQRYVDQSGIVTLFSQALVAIYEEGQRPADATELFKQKLGAASLAEVSRLQEQVAKLQQELETCKAENQSLTARLAELEA